jgi:hypothetical protein
LFSPNVVRQANLIKNLGETPAATLNIYMHKTRGFAQFMARKAPYRSACGAQAALLRHVYAITVAASA